MRLMLRGFRRIGQATSQAEPFGACAPLWEAQRAVDRRWRDRADWRASAVRARGVCI